MFHPAVARGNFLVHLSQVRPGGSGDGPGLLVRFHSSDGAAELSLFDGITTFM
jgi:hypothetical protein